MFDKLGSLLSDALEAGEIPQYEQKAAASEKSADAAAHSFSAHDSASFADSSTQDQPNAARENAQAQYAYAAFHAQSAPKKKLRWLTESEKQAFKTLGIAQDVSYSEAKRIYREKLQRFHPDKQGDNAVLQKIAREKTAQFIAAWETIKALFAKG